MTRERWRLIITNDTVAETHQLVLARSNQWSGLRFLNLVQRGNVRFGRDSEENEAQARAIIRRSTDNDFSLTAAISFAVMERLRIGYAFAFDRHFAQDGVLIVTP